MRVLFFKAAFSWPRSSGHDVHTYEMMRAIEGLGAHVGLVTLRTPPAAALAGLALETYLSLDDGVTRSQAPAAPQSCLAERFRNYWGVSTSHVAVLGETARAFRADAVVVSGLDVLPMLGAVEGALRVWYAADEWVWHHLSQVRLFERRSWGNLRAAAIKGIYERSFRSRLDRVWVVSEPDRRAFRWLAGIGTADVLPNGVDADAYHPLPGREAPETAVFWGRLDFGPNVQALEWFFRKVWPSVRQVRPTARFTIIGFQPGREIEDLAKLPGVELKPNLADIRPEVARHAVVVLPFTSGGGIKNKLLEAAAMGKAIVGSPRALTGLRGSPPVRVARRPDEWCRTLVSLWDDEAGRRELGENARSWVLREHTWQATARAAWAGLEESLNGRTPS